MSKQTQYGDLAYSAPKDWHDSTVVTWVLPQLNNRHQPELSITLAKQPTDDRGFEAKPFFDAQIEERKHVWTTPPVVKPSAIHIQHLAASVTTFESTFSSPVGDIWQLQTAFQCASHNYVFTATGLSSGDKASWRQKFHALISSMELTN